VIVVAAADAESDLEQIATHIAEQSVEIVLNFVQEPQEKCESPADAPRGYPLVPRHQSMIWKSGYRFSEKIMLKQKNRAG
jgi:plasmid stabilization system protein ParE